LATMAFSNSTLSILVLVSLSVAVLAVLLLLPAALRDRASRVRSGGSADKRFDARIGGHADAIKRLEAAVRKLAAGEQRLAGMSEGAVQHVAVVRFDAFEDMGGRLSFSAALLDGRGDGVVITSINGRQDTRCYAKQVRGGRSVHNLSDEERQVIREALEGARPRPVAEAGRGPGG
jgi:hypothetical protein